MALLASTQPPAINARAHKSTLFTPLQLAAGAGRRRRGTLHATALPGLQAGRQGPGAAGGIPMQRWGPGQAGMSHAGGVKPMQRSGLRQAMPPAAAAPSGASALGVVWELVQRLEGVGAEHTLLGRAAALVQGVQLEVQSIEVVVQWDFMPAAHRAFASGAGPWLTSPLHHRGACSWFWSSYMQGEADGSGGSRPVLVCCQQGTVVAGDAHRLQVQFEAPEAPTRSSSSLSGGTSPRWQQHRGEAPGSAGDRHRSSPSSSNRPPAAAGGGGRASAWARSLYAVQRQARGAASSAALVVLPREAWAPPPPGGGGGGAAAAASLPSSTQPPDPGLDACISAHLRAAQAAVGRGNGEAWGGEDAYAAWCVRFGAPEAAAARIAADPAARLGPLLEHLQILVREQRGQAPPRLAPGSRKGAGAARRGKGGPGGEDMDGVAEGGGAAAPAGPVRVANLMGSHGSKALAMALCPGLGIVPTVVDISEGNARYARALAAAAGLTLDYRVHDVLSLTAGPAAPGGELHAAFHGVVMEMGILHYFLDLAPLMAAVAALLRPGGGGRLVLRDFHPVSTKLISSKGKKHKVEGDYFQASLATSDVAFSKHSRAPAAGQVEGGGGAGSGGAAERRAPAKQVLLRRWTLGEVVTAVAEAGLVVVLLEEEQGVKADDKGLPKAFTLVAKTM